jgi:hypothetical protein
LCEGHAKELIPTRELPHSKIAAGATDAVVEIVRRQEVQQLRKDGLPSIHRPAPSIVKWKEHGLDGKPS